MASQIKKVKIYFRGDNGKAVQWQEKIKNWLKKNYPEIKIDSPKQSQPQVVIVLGGDGTILEAVRLHDQNNPIFFGLNLGHVGFLAAVRGEKDFLTGLEKLLKGDYEVIEKMQLSAEVARNGKVIFQTYALNEAVVKHLFGVVNLEVSINDHLFQTVHGDGVMVSTATGSTAYNLSAHGPIVMPNIKCLILKELLDHDIPTPSVVIKHDNKVSIKIISFREQGKFMLTNPSTGSSTEAHSKSLGQAADVVLIADGSKIFPLKAGDEVVICKHSELVRFAELEKNYFLKSLQEKFSFK